MCFGSLLGNPMKRGSWRSYFSFRGELRAVRCTWWVRLWVLPWFRGGCLRAFSAFLRSPALASAQSLCSLRARRSFWARGRCSGSQTSRTSRPQRSPRPRLREPLCGSFWCFCWFWGAPCCVGREIHVATAEVGVFEVHIIVKKTLCRKKLQ